MPSTALPTVAYLHEGTLGDSLVALPTLRLLIGAFGAGRVHVISLGSVEELSLARLAEARLPLGQTRWLAVHPRRPAAYRLAAWLRVAAALAALRPRICVYGLRPDHPGAARRMAWHRRFLWAPGRRLVGATDGETAPLLYASDGRYRDVALGRLLFERTCRGLGLDPRQQPFDASWPILDDERRQADAWLRPLAGERLVAVCLTSRQAATAWPLARYTEVLRALAGDGVTPVLVGAAGDAATHARVLAAVGRGASAAGRPPGVVAGILARCAFYLGNDTGPMHLAAAVGLPCVAVFSARNPRGHWEPLGRGHTILRAEIDCEACFLSACDERRNACLALIGTDAVLAACRARLAAAPGAARRDAG